MRHKEKDFIKPAILFIYYHPMCSMLDLKNGIDNYIELSKEDLEKSSSRNEEKYKQIIGNLVSHDTLDFFKYVSKIIPDSELEKKSPKLIFRLNEQGVSLVEEYLNDRFMNELDDFFDFNDMINTRIDNSINIESINCRRVIVDDLTDNSQRLNSSAELSKYMVGKKECFFDSGHEIVVDSMSGTNLLFPVRIIPLNAYKDFYPNNIDVSDNVICLCPTCYLKIKRGTPTVRRKMLEEAYNERIDSLTRRNLFIEFDKLMDYYN